MTDGFDEYISLGCDCEGGFQIRRILGQDSSSFFNWNITSLAALHGLLAHRFEGILQDANISVHGDGALLNDHAHEYKFHSPFDRADYRNDPAFEARFADYREKTRYLVEKFLRARPPGHRTAYFYKAELGTTATEVRAAMPAVRDLLAGIHGPAEFALVVLQPEDRQEAPWGEPLIHNRYLRRTAPWNDAADAHVTSWDRVFREFPSKAPMRLAGY